MLGRLLGWVERLGTVVRRALGILKHVGSPGNVVSECEVVGSREVNARYNNFEVVYLVHKIAVETQV